MKSLKWLSVILAASLTLAGCGTNTKNDEAAAPDSGNKTTISFINGFTGGDGAFMKKITDGFNQSQDKYVIKETQDKDHYTKFKSGSYDMVVIHTVNLKTYKDDGMIQDVTPFMEKAGIKESDFDPAGVDVSKVDGKMYALPLDIHPLTMLYNKDLVSKAPATYDDLIQLQSELKAKDPNLYALGVPSSGLVEFYIMTMAAQNGINMVKDDYLNFAQPELADALLTFNKMIYQDKISPAGLGLDGEFQSFMKEAKDSNAAVQSAVSLTGPWFYSAAKEKYGDKLGVAPVPVLGKQAAVYGNAHTIAVSSKVKDQKVLDGITEFYKYLYTPEHLIHWAESGQAPVHKATMDYIAAHKDEYPLSYVNQQQFSSFATPARVYQYGEQIRYMNESVFAKVVSTPNITKEDIMKELEAATEKAKQIAATHP